MSPEKSVGDAPHGTNHHAHLMEQIRAEVSRLAMPNLSTLRIVLTTRRKALTERDAELAREQDEVSAAGMAAAIGLMMPDQVNDADTSAIDTPYTRVLPKRIRRED